MFKIENNKLIFHNENDLNRVKFFIDSFEFSNIDKLIMQKFNLSMGNYHISEEKQKPLNEAKEKLQKEILVLENPRNSKYIPVADKNRIEEIKKEIYEDINVKLAPLQKYNSQIWQFLQKAGINYDICKTIEHEYYLKTHNCLLLPENLSYYTFCNDETLNFEIIFISCIGENHLVKTFWKKLNDIFSFLVKELN